jgi:hypothetical protein
MASGQNMFTLKTCVQAIYQLLEVLNSKTCVQAIYQLLEVLAFPCLFILLIFSFLPVAT